MHSTDVCLHDILLNFVVLSWNKFLDDVIETHMQPYH